MAMNMIANAIQGKMNMHPGPPYFQDGICDCCSDTGVCMQTVFCTFCTLANIQTKRDTGLGMYDCSSCCVIMVYTYFTGGDAFLSMGFSFRRELVQRYGIMEESVCKSCCLSICCWPCTICQVQREMNRRLEPVGGCCSVAPPIVMMAAGGMMANVGMVTSRPWTTGLCQCAGAADCCEGFWCPCLLIGYMNNRLESGRMATKPFGMPNSVDCLTCIGSLWWPFGYVYANRREIIERYNIGGESHNITCLNAYLCTFCALCQQRREMGYTNEWPGGLCLTALPPRMM